jgi:hypothetical protein
VTLCPACGLRLGEETVDGRVGICGHHAGYQGENWSDGNRIWCDWVHRGIVPPRLEPRERDDDFWAYVLAPDAPPPAQDAA